MGGGGGVERSPIKKSWGEGVKMKKLGVYMKKIHWGGSEIVGVPPPPPPPPCILKWNSPNDTVFEVIVLEYDRYESPLGARSCHKYLVVWQDLKIGINYVNHVLLVILRHIGTFKNVVHILIVQ